MTLFTYLFTVRVLPDTPNTLTQYVFLQQQHSYVQDVPDLFTCTQFQDFLILKLSNAQAK